MTKILTLLATVTLPLFSQAQSNPQTFIKGMKDLVRKDRVTFNGKTSGQECKVDMVFAKNRLTVYGEVKGKLVSAVDITPDVKADRAIFGDKLVIGNFSRKETMNHQVLKDSVVISKDHDDIKMVRVQMASQGVGQQVTCWMD